LIDPDDALVERARAGDVRAFEVLLRRYQDSLYSFVRTRVDDAAAAEDIAQEVFIGAHANLASLKDAGRFAAWLFGIAKMKVLLYRRNERRRPDRTHPELDTVPRPAPGEDTGEVLKGILEGLPDEARVVLLLRFRDALSYREIADRLGMPVGTVSTILNRARAAAASNHERLTGERPVKMADRRP
jgi:RNA polymerase sigma-70 factor (ECF subfamily)